MESINKKKSMECLKTIMRKCSLDVFFLVLYISFQTDLKLISLIQKNFTNNPVCDISMTIAPKRQNKTTTVKVH